MCVRDLEVCLDPVDLSEGGGVTCPVADGCVQLQRSYLERVEGIQGVVAGSSYTTST